MKIAIVAQIKDRAGLGKAINDFKDYCYSRKDNVVEIDITNNKKFISNILKILKADVDTFYFTPSGSLGGNLRDAVYLLSMILRKKKITTHFHNSAFGKVIERNKFVKHLNKYLYSKVDSIIVLGEKSKLMFKSIDVPDRKFQVIRNGIDEYMFIDEKGLDEKFKQDKINIIYFSNMMEEKGYKVVLDTAKKMQDNSQYHFYFSGKFFDDELKNEFEKEVADMENITYINGVYGEDKKNLLHKMHYFVLPSYYKDETLPISMLEAIASGLYVIVSDVGVISEVVNKETTTLLSKVNEQTSEEIKTDILKTSDNLKTLNFSVEEYKKNMLSSKIQETIHKSIKISLTSN